MFVRLVCLHSDLRLPPSNKKWENVTYLLINQMGHLLVYERLICLHWGSWSSIGSDLNFSWLYLLPLFLWLPLFSGNHHSCFILSSNASMFPYHNLNWAESFACLHKPYHKSSFFSSNIKCKYLYIKTSKLWNFFMGIAGWNRRICEE